MVASSPPLSATAMLVDRPTRPPPEPGVQVLVVDPNRGERRAVIRQLRAAGLSTIATGPADAVAAAGWLRPQVVVLDPRSGGTDPVVLIRRLCGQVLGVMVVAYTSVHDQAADRALLAAGVHQIIAKRRRAELIHEVLGLC